MKKILAVISLLTGALALTPAKAADIAPAYKAPAYAPYNWTGFYVGGFVGGAWSQNSEATDLDGYNDIHSWSYGSPRSVIAGGTIGYNWQSIGSPWLFGLEGELGYLQLSESAADPISFDTVAASKVGDWYGVVAARLGYAWNHWLLYAKGGAVFTELRASVIDACNTGSCGGDLITASTSKNHTGWALGGGLEYALANSWSVKAEYLYLGVDRTLRSCGVNSVGVTFCFDNDVQGAHTAKFGVNYRFGGL